jgi:hypothetical protein
VFLLAEQMEDAEPGGRLAKSIVGFRRSLGAVARRRRDGYRCKPHGFQLPQRLGFKNQLHRFKECPRAA